jgi:hypothetical protein
MLCMPVFVGDDTLSECGMHSMPYGTFRKLRFLSLITMLSLAKQGFEEVPQGDLGTREIMRRA